jgi:hypothetical protein
VARCWNIEVAAERSASMPHRRRQVRASSSLCDAIACRSRSGGSRRPTPEFLAGWVLLSWPEAAWLRLMGLPGRGAGRSEAGTRIQVAEGVGAAAGGVFLVATVHSACAVASLIPARRRRLLSCGRPTRRRAAAPGQGPLQFDLQ